MDGKYSFAVKPQSSVDQFSNERLGRKPRQGVKQRYGDVSWKAGRHRLANHRRIRVEKTRGRLFGEYADMSFTAFVALNQSSGIE
jgi:hypothetical protein